MRNKTKSTLCNSDNANKEDIESCDKNKERIYTKKGEDIFIIEGRERKNIQVHQKNNWRKNI